MKPAAREPEAGDRVPFLTIGAYWLASRAVILTVAGLSLEVVGKGRHFRNPASGLDWFNVWDAEWYLRIAHWGYRYPHTGGQEGNVAFFPLYPLLVRAVAFTGLDARLAGYLVSNLALLGAALLLWKLVVRETGNQRTALSAVAFLLVGPVSFFFSTIYTEGLWLFLTLGALYWAKQERWLAAGVCGYFAALTRAYGFLLVLPMLWEFLQPSLSRPWLRPRAAWWKAVNCGLPALGVATYMAFLWRQFGEPLAFQKAQMPGWGRGLAPFWVGMEGLLKRGEPFYQFWFLGAWLVGILLLQLGLYLRVRPSYLIWAAAIYGLVVSSTILEALPRLLSGICSYYIILAALAARWPKAEVPLLCGSSMLLAFSVVLFVNGYWFT
jgi:hypothetical protein